MHGKDKQWVVSKVLYSLSVWGWSEIVVVSVFFTAAGKSLFVRTEPLAGGGLQQDDEGFVPWRQSGALPLSRNGDAAFIPAHEWMSRAPANNSERYRLLPVCAKVSCGEKQNKTNENIIHRHLWKFLMLESYKRVPGLFIITAQHRFVDSRPEFTTTPQSSKSSESLLRFTYSDIDKAHKTESDIILSWKCQHNQSLI